MDKTLERLADAQDQKDAKARVYAIRGKGWLEMTDLPQAGNMQSNALRFRKEEPNPKRWDISESLSLWGEVHYVAGELTEAETLYREALTFKEWRPWMTSPGILESSVYRFADVLLAQHKDREAEDFLSTMMQRASQDPSHSGNLYRACGVFHARRQDWPRAIEDLDRAVKTDSRRVSDWYLQGILLVQTGNDTRYQQLCENLLSQRGVATNDTTARRIAKICLLAPLPTANLQTVGTLLPRQLPPDERRKGAVRLMQGWLAFRQAEYTNATNYLKQALDFARREPKDPIVLSQSQLLLALVSHHLKQSAVAAAYLDEARKFIAGRPPAEKLGNQRDEVWWVETLANSLLLREAERLME
jgi:tetratricopeptide (TPR) repeat protein